MELTFLLVMIAGTVLGAVQPAYDFLSDDTRHRRNARLTIGTAMLTGAAASTAVFFVVGEGTGLALAFATWAVGVLARFAYERTEPVPDDPRNDRKFKGITFLGALLGIVGAVGALVVYAHDQSHPQKSNVRVERLAVAAPMQHLRSD